MPSTTRRRPGCWPAWRTSARPRASVSRWSRSPGPPATCSGSPTPWWTGSSCGPPATTTRSWRRSRPAGSRPSCTQARGGPGCPWSGSTTGPPPPRSAGWPSPARPVVLGFPVNRERDRALLTGAPGPSVTYPVTRHRWNGYLDAWREAGGDPAGLRVAVCQANATGLGEAFADELLRGDDPPDAITAMSDELALG